MSSSGGTLFKVAAGTVFVACAFAVAFKVLGGSSGAQPSLPSPRREQSRQASARPSGAASPEAQGGAAVAPNTVLIVYGSNTGTAEQYAKDLASDGRRKGFNTVVVEGSQFATDADAPFGPYRNIVFVVATYGEGDPTDDFRDALKTLQTTTAIDSVDRRVAIFGLGDRSYKYFCKTAKDVEAAALRLKCTIVAETALGDARGELEATFDEWREAMWASMATKTGLALSSAPLAPEATFTMLPVDAAADPSPFPTPASASEPTKTRPIRVRIADVRELVNQTECDPRERRSTLHVELDLSSVNNVAYQAGDHCGIFPCNPDGTVEEYLQRLSVSPDDAARIVELTKDVETRSGAKKPVNQLPARISLRNVFKWYLNLCGPPKRSTLRVCAQYCEDESERDAFNRLVSPGADAATFRAALDRNRTVLGFLREFPSCRVPVGHFIEAMPPIAPRFFSIASDQLAHPKAIHLTIGIVAGGLCSGMVAQLQPGSEVVMFVRKSSFHLPLRQKSKPVILIGPGTGIAPFIGFCQRRQAWASKTELGPCYFFFGCRREREDFLYRSQLEAWAADGKVITRLITAFSRDQSQKVYVQHRISEMASEIFDVMTKQGGYLFICGDASKMAKDVESALLKILQEHGRISEDAANNQLKKWEVEGRYLKDVWAS